MMANGRRLGMPTSLVEARRFCAREQEALPATVRELHEGATRYPVQISKALHELAAKLDMQTV
jgi:hypothetical protein